MVEIFKHAFGLCGDSHPSLLTLAGFTSLLYLCKTYINMFWLMCTNFIKTFLERFYKLFRHN
jgi:hypothetical protein